MAIDDVIQQHTEEVEFLRESARNAVIDILSDAQIEEMLSDPEGFVDRLLAALVVALEPYVDELVQRAKDYAAALELAPVGDDEIDQAANDSQNGFLLAARPALLAAIVGIDDQIQAQLDSGVSAATLDAALKSEATQEALLGAFEAAAKRAAAAYLHDLERSILTIATDLLTQAQVAGALTLSFTWIAVMDSNTCFDIVEDSCGPRHGMTNSLDSWDRGLGRPGAPQLLCSLHTRGKRSGCRCVLTPAKSVAGLLNPVSVIDSVRRGKQRAAVGR